MPCGTGKSVKVTTQKRKFGRPRKGEAGRAEAVGEGERLWDGLKIPHYPVPPTKIC